MKGRDYIQLQNQGNIISNIRLLYEMMNSDGYADENGYFTKKDVADIACNALILTTGSKVGEEVTSVIHGDGDESRNSPLQNAKARMQLLRVLGLVSSDYGSEIYAITRLGKLIVSQVLSPTPNMGLLRELFLHISSATEIYEHNCDIKFNCVLGYGIMYAFSKLDYRISTDEMPLLTAYDISDVDLFIRDAKKFRELDRPFPQEHLHFPKTSQMKPLKNVSNLTRSINQILKTCGIVYPKVRKIGKKNYYACTEDGIRFIDSVTSHFEDFKFLTSPQFRKINNITKQKELCNACYQNLLIRSGIEPDACIIQDYKNTVFSPYQMLPETNVEWLLGGKIRKHPESQESKILAINSQISQHDIRLKDLFFNKEKSNIDLFPLDSELVEIFKSEIEAGISIDDLALSICEQYKPHSKDIFYPFVHSLLRIIGLDCMGEVGRYDALCSFNAHTIPVEIKSYGETPTYNLKGLRQAVENKIMSYNPQISDDIKFASLVVGYDHPSMDNDVRQFIDASLDNFGIRIIASDLRSLVKMAIRVQTENISVDLDSFLQNYGLLRS